MDPPPTTKSLPSLLAGYFSSTFKSRPWTTNDDDDDDHHHHSPPQLQLEYTQSKIQPEKEIEYRFVVMGGSGVVRTLSSTYRMPPPPNDENTLLFSV